MAKFIFRLESFLNVKVKLEEQKKLEYGKALQMLEEEKNKKLELENKCALTLKGMKDKMKKGINPDHIRMSNQYINFLKKEIDKQIIEIQKAEEFAEKKRLELVEAMKEKKMLETLKEKDYETFREEQKIEEQKIVDEIVSYRYSEVEDNGKQ